MSTSRIIYAFGASIWLSALSPGNAENCIVYPLTQSYPEKILFRARTPDGYIPVYDKPLPNLPLSEVANWQRGYILEGDVLQGVECTSMPGSVWLRVLCPVHPASAAGLRTRCNPSLSTKVWSERGDHPEAMGWIPIRMRDFTYLLQVNGAPPQNTRQHNAILGIDAWLCTKTQMSAPACVVSSHASGTVVERLNQNLDTIEATLKAQYGFSSVYIKGSVKQTCRAGCNRRLEGRRYQDSEHYEIDFEATGGDLRFKRGRTFLHDILQRFLDDADAGVGVLVASVQGNEAEDNGPAAASEPDEASEEAAFQMMVIIVSSSVFVCLCISCLCVCFLSRRRKGFLDETTTGLW